MYRYGTNDWYLIVIKYCFSTLHPLLYSLAFQNFHFLEKIKNITIFVIFSKISYIPTLQSMVKKV